MKGSMKGAVIATAVEGMFIAKGVVAQMDGKAEAKKVHCEGVNECKGKGECGGASHDCAGKNGCKGKGWVEMSPDDCKGKGGTAK